MSGYAAVPGPGGFIRETGQSEAMPDAVDVIVDASNPDAVKLDPSGALLIETPDGGVDIDFSGGTSKSGAGKFNDNLAEYIDGGELGRIAEELLQGIEADEQDRAEWLETRSRGIDLLGLKLERPRSSGTADSAPVEGMSTVRHPMLLEATLRFQANARGELLPADGPVKVKNWDDTAVGDEMAEALENDFNYFLTTTAKEYYPDTDRGLFRVGYGGCIFKKVINCPLRQRPVSETVDPEDLIVNANAIDLSDARRITHRIQIRQSMLRRMQMLGLYRDVELMQPVAPQPDMVKQKVAETQGLAPLAQRPEDHPYTLYETLCELDIAGYGHKKGGKETGMPLPYKVTIDKDSRTVLEVRRNWAEDDDLCMPKKVYVKYPFVPGLGFYDIGLVHILGNTTNALTAAWREMLDAGMFASFPGFLYSDTVGRQQSMTMRVAPGSGVRVQTGGNPIGQSVMALPYKDPSSVLLAFTQHVEDLGMRAGGTAELQVAEGRQDAPVGTTLAMIEQATKVMDAVHKRLHAAQAEEFQLLKDRFKEDPEAFWRHNRRPSLDWTEDKLMQALDDHDIVPYADPNTPSHMHRVMKAVALLQLVQQMPQYFNVPEVLQRVLHMAGIADADALMLPGGPQQAPQGPKPEDVLDAQTRLQIAQTQLQAKVIQAKSDMAQAQMDAQQRSADRGARFVTDKMKLAADVLRDRGPVQQTIGPLQSSGLMPPANPSPAMNGVGP